MFYGERQEYRVMRSNFRLPLLLFAAHSSLGQFRLSDAFYDFRIGWETLLLNCSRGLEMRLPRNLRNPNTSCRALISISVGNS